jgi:hypothetical protein
LLSEYFLRTAFRRTGAGVFFVKFSQIRWRHSFICPSTAPHLLAARRPENTKDHPPETAISSGYSHRITNRPKSQWILLKNFLNSTSHL